MGADVVGNAVGPRLRSGAGWRSRYGQMDTNVIDEAEERGWLSRHLAGDCRALPALVRRYRAPVYGYLVRSGVPEAARGDLFREVFQRVHGSASTYEPQQSLKPWLFAVVANAVRRHDLRAARQPSTQRDGETQADPSCELEAPDTSSFLERRLQDLPPAQREVLLLVSMEQMPLLDVADALDMPLHTVKMLLRRARLSLARALTRRQAQLSRKHGEASP